MSLPYKVEKRKRCEKWRIRERLIKDSFQLVILWELILRQSIFKAGYVYHNIEDIDLETFMDEKVYDEYCHNILLFKKAQDLYAQQIRSFVLEGKKS